MGVAAASKRALPTGDWCAGEESTAQARPYELPQELPDGWPGRAASRAVRAAGCCWHVQRMGRGPTMLLLHGTASSTHTWRDLLPLLADHYDVVAVDLPGHGFSERLPGGAMSLPAIAAAIGELLRALNCNVQFVVGHSAGAAIALRMVLDRTMDPRAVVGLNAALLPFGGVMQKLLSPMAQLFSSTRLMPAMIARRAKDVRAVERVLRGTGSQIDAAGVACYQRLLQREENVAGVLAMMASWNLQPLLADLPSLHVPLHLVTGDRDRAVSPGEADRITATLPAATVTHLEDCGHLAHEERPARVAAIVRDHCPLPEAPGQC